MGMTAHPPLVTHPSAVVLSCRCGRSGPMVVFYRYRRVVVGVVKCFRRLLQLSGVVVDGQWWLVSEVMGCDGM